MLSILVATALGPWGFAAALIGLVLAWLYSAPPFRLKLNGWWGNAAVAVCYEGLPWITGAVVMGVPMPAWRIIALAGLYSFRRAWDYDAERLQNPSKCDIRMGNRLAAGSPRRDICRATRLRGHGRAASRCHCSSNRLGIIRIRGQRWVCC